MAPSRRCSSRENSTNSALAGGPDRGGAGYALATCEDAMKSLLAFAFAALLSLPALSRAADYPTRPVNFILGFAPGGPSDVMARGFSKKLEQELGQPIVIDNRTGAGGNIAAQHVAA